MKRWIAMLLIAVLTVGGFCFAEEGLRFKVHEDVSEFTVGEELDQAQQENADTATIHTEVYLFVDPDTASYVTFIVYDDDGNLLPGASIYITYKGAEELLGVSDGSGKASMYIFRDVTYGYRVEKDGYETASGSFTATEETKRVKVVLRKYRKIILEAQYDGEPWPNATMYLDGEKIFADENGRSALLRVNGDYLLELELEDGRRIMKRITVRGDGMFVINYAPDDLLAPGSAYSDRFLVYSEEYNPKDYQFAEYTHTAEDVERLPGETDEEYEARVNRYLEEHPSEIIVNALPVDGVFPPRAMIPSGWLQRAWEGEGFQQVTFANGVESMRFRLDDLYNPQMKRAFAVLYAMTEGKKTDIAGDEELYKESGLASLMKKDSVVLSEALLAGVKDFDFAFENTDNENLLPNSVYDNAWFEYWLIPIDTLQLWEMIERSAQEPTADEEIILANADYLRNELRKWRAEGGISAHALDELLEILADNLLTSDEARRVYEMVEKREYEIETVQSLLSRVVEGSMYRAACRICRGNVYVDVTELLDSLQISWDADALTEIETYRAIFIREPIDAESAVAEETSEHTEGTDDLYELAMDKLTRNVTIIIVESDDSALDDQAEPADREIIDQPDRLLQTTLPFAGITALVEMNNTQS